MGLKKNNKQTNKHFAQRYEISALERRYKVYKVLKMIEKKERKNESECMSEQANFAKHPLLCLMISSKKKEKRGKAMLLYKH